MVVNEDKLEEVRSVRRLSVEKRWSEDNLNWVKWVPWRKYKGAEEADGDLPEGVPVEEKGASAGGNGGIVFIETKERPPRDYYITFEDVKKYGITRGCGGCSSFTRGLARQPHTEPCRERLRKLMKDEVKVKQAEERKRVRRKTKGEAKEERGKEGG